VIPENIQSPFVSIIMPVRNEQDCMARVLNSLLAQDYPRSRMEIIVADGMSTDNTRQIVSISAEVDSRIHLINNPRRIMAAGFNEGLNNASGDIIIMMGGHTELASDYVKNCSSILQEGVADCVGGPISTVCPTRRSEAISLALSSRFGVGGVAFRMGCRERKYVDTAAFGAYTREIMERTGPLDEEFVRNQDDEFNYRLRKFGGRILLAPEIRSQYISRSSLRSLWRQYFQYGYWKVRVLQKHPRQMQSRHFVPAVFVSLLLLSSVLMVVDRSAIGSAIFFFLCCVYLIAITLVSVSIVLQKGKWRLAPALALCFPVLHFSYGTGFLVGLAKFWDRWRETQKVDLLTRRTDPLKNEEPFRLAPRIKNRVEGGQYGIE